MLRSPWRSRTSARTSSASQAVFGSNRRGLDTVGRQERRAMTDCGRHFEVLEVRSISQTLATSGRSRRSGSAAYVHPWPAGGIQQPGQQALGGPSSDPGPPESGGLRRRPWFPVVEITNCATCSSSVSKRPSSPSGRRTSSACEIIPPGGVTVVHRLEKRDDRQAHVDELARRFDERGPDDAEGAI